jgi:hypothetical protein
MRFVVFAGLGLLGCTARVDEPSGTGGSGSEPIATAGEAISSCGCGDHSYTRFVPGSPNAIDTGLASDDHLCWVTGVTYSGIPEQDVQIYTGPSSSNWMIWGWGEVQCLPRCCFFSNGGSSDVRWKSGNFGATAYTPETPSASAPMWLDDAMPIMNGIYFSGPADKGQQQVNAFWSQGFGRVSSVMWSPVPPNGTYTTVYGYSFFVGIPHTSHDVEYIDYPWHNDSTPLTNISTSAGICTIKGLSARYGRPTGAYAKIYRSSGVWKTRAYDPDIDIRTRCFYFNQDQ